MKNRFFADPYKLAAAAGTILVFLLLCLWNVLRGDLFGFFFLLPALPFIYVAYLYGTMVEVREDQLMIRRPGKAVRSLPWTEIAEMGVIGTKVFNRSNPEKTGALYIYFSLVALDDESRFQMALKWPPKEQVYLLYTKERMDYIRPFWFGKVQKYNAGRNLIV